VGGLGETVPFYSIWKEEKERKEEVALFSRPGTGKGRICLAQLLKRSRKKGRGKEDRLLLDRKKKKKRT